MEVPRTSWPVLVTVYDTYSAAVLSERLRSEGVPAVLKSDSAILGEARRCDILVAPEMLYRAKQILSESVVSDAELTYLATGELPSADGS